MFQGSIDKHFLNPDDEDEPEQSTCQNQMEHPELSESVKIGVQILRYFPGEQLCGQLLTLHFKLSDGDLHEPSIRHCLDSLWSEFGVYLVEPRQTDLLSIMAEKITQNELTPLSASSNNEQWLTSFSGKNTRWEIIGVSLRPMLFPTGTTGDVLIVETSIIRHSMRCLDWRLLPSSKQIPFLLGAFQQRTRSSGHMRWAHLPKPV